MKNNTNYTSKVKKTCYLLLIIMLTAWLNFQLFLPSNAISIPDENLKQCILNKFNEDHSSNYSGINEINLDQIYELTCENSNIEDLTGIDNLHNLSFLDIRSNSITSIEPLLYINSLKTVWLQNNLLDTTPLRSFDEATMSSAKTLIERGVNLEGLCNQIISHNEASAIGKPQLHVLFVYVTEIDAHITNGGNEVHYQHTLTDAELGLFEAYKDQFEKAAEKLSNYRFDIVTDVYKTTKKYTYADVGKEDYLLINIDEIESIRANYDTVFVNAIYGNIVTHSSSGRGTMGKAVVYFDEQSDEQNLEETKVIRNNIPTRNTSSFLHEFIHSIEFYGAYMNQNIWEWHSAISYMDGSDDLRNLYGNQNQFKEISGNEYGIVVDPYEFIRGSLYFQGITNPDGSGKTGFTEAIIELPYSKLLQNPDKTIITNINTITLSAGEQEQLYAVSKSENQTIYQFYGDIYSTPYSFDEVEWSSNDNNVASVSDSGIVEAISGGKTEIIAQRKNSSDYAIVEIEVIDPNPNPTPEPNPIAPNTGRNTNTDTRNGVLMNTISNSAIVITVFTLLAYFVSRTKTHIIFDHKK